MHVIANPNIGVGAGPAGQVLAGPLFRWCNEIHYRYLRARRYRPRAICACLFQPDNFKSPSYAPDKPRQTVSWPTMRALCAWHVLTVMQMRVLSQFFAKGSASYKTTPETLINIHQSLGMRPQQDYTFHVTLNNCVSAHWSPMCQHLALTSLRDSQSPFAYKAQLWVSNALNTDKRFFFSLP